MAKERIFTTLPARAIGDGRLSALDLRALGAIALHDGMSLVKGSGRGCYARASVLAGILAVDITSFSRTMSKLIKLGYIVREPQQNDKRRFTLRVIYKGNDTCHAGQLSNPSFGNEAVDGSVNHQPYLVDGAVNHPAEIVDINETRNGSFSSETGTHYIPLNGELHSVETVEINSDESAQRAVASNRFNEIVRDASKVLKVDSEARTGHKKNRAEASARQGASIRNLLPKNFNGLPIGAQLQSFERALKEIDADNVDLQEAREFEAWLWEVWDNFSRDLTIGPWSRRLYENLPWEIAA